MPRTLPCPHTASNHDGHEKGSREYQTCSENERREEHRRSRIAIEQLLAAPVAEVSPTVTTWIPELTPMQTLDALANLTAPKDKSDGQSFGW